LVVGISGIGGLAGYNPQTVRRYVAAAAKVIPFLKVFINDEPKRGDPDDPRDNPPKSDSDARRTMFGK
jgi:hypothetical protein